MNDHSTFNFISQSDVHASSNITNTDTRTNQTKDELIELYILHENYKAFQLLIDVHSIDSQILLHIKDAYDEYTQPGNADDVRIPALPEVINMNQMVGMLHYLRQAFDHIDWDIEEYAENIVLRRRPRRGGAGGGDGDIPREGMENADDEQADDDDDRVKQNHHSIADDDILFNNNIKFDVQFIGFGKEFISNATGFPPYLDVLKCIEPSKETENGNTEGESADNLMSNTIVTVDNDEGKITYTIKAACDLELTEDSNIINDINYLQETAKDIDSAVKSKRIRWWL